MTSAAHPPLRPAVAAPQEDAPAAPAAAGALHHDARLRLYHEVFLASPAAVAIVDVEGRYLEQNAAHARLLGYADDELAGRTPAIHLGEATFGVVAEALRREGRFRGEVVSRTKDGLARLLDLAAFSVRDDRGAVVCHVGIKHDITGQRETEATLRQRIAELEAIDAVTDAAARAGGLDSLAAAAIDRLCEVLRADRAALLLADGAGVFRFRAWRGLSDAYRAAVEGHSPWSHDDPDPAPVLVEDARQDARLGGLAEVVRREGIRALSFVPLRAGGRLLGKVMLYYNDPHTFGRDEVRLAQAIARALAHALERVQAEQEREALLARLREQNERLEEMQVVKTQFLNTVSHELRTPMTPILLQLRILRSQTEADKRERALDVLERNVHRLNDLVQDTLEVARLQSGKLPLHVERFDLDAQVQACVESFAEAARSRGIALEVHLGAGAQVDADPQRIAQVVDNLLSNALKFTPPGGAVAVATARQDGLAHVRVADTGPGLDAQQRARLFEPFSQVHDGASAAGTGLGLFISRGLVEQHGGRIGVESPGPGKGAVFSFTLPLRHGAAPSSEPPAPI